MSLLRSQNAGQTGLSRTTQAVSSTSTWYAFAGHVRRQAPLLMNGEKSGSMYGPSPVRKVVRP